jgi:hypothetical protein
MAAVADLVPYAQNSRLHDAANIDLLAKLITEYGWTTPILVGRNGNVIAGHGRILAAEQLGMAEVPTLLASHLNAKQIRAYRMCGLPRCAADAGGHRCGCDGPAVRNAVGHRHEPI